MTLIVAIQYEDAKLERAMDSIRLRCGRGEMTRLDAAQARVAAFEAHLAACQAARRKFTAVPM
jgi:hypothetical protein